LLANFIIATIDSLTIYGEAIKTRTRLTALRYTDPSRICS
jgi:hypothetical protein